MTGGRGDLLELLEAFPGDPLQIGAVLGREGLFDRATVTVLVWVRLVQVSYTKAFQRYALEPSRYMTISVPDYSRTLAMGW